MGNSQNQSATTRIRVGMSSCGIAAGADEVYAVLNEEASKRKMDIDLGKCGCSGSCYAEPLVQVEVPGLPSVTYGRVSKDVALRIVEEHVAEKRLLNDHIIDLPVRRQ